MEEYIDQVESFLRGQMSLQEEAAFKASISSNEHFLSLAWTVVVLVKSKKS